jgi:hypothetical protein
MTFHPRVKIVGEKLQTRYGLQTLLGEHTVRTRRSKNHVYTRVSRAGFGICGAVTYWLFHLWLSTGSTQSLDAFYERVVHTVQKHKLRAQHAIYAFIKEFNTSTQTHYTSYTQRYIIRDLQVIQKELQRKYNACFKKYDCSVVYNIKTSMKHTYEPLLTSTYEHTLNV